MIEHCERCGVKKARKYFEEKKFEKLHREMRNGFDGNDSRTGKACGRTIRNWK